MKTPLLAVAFVLSTGYSLLQLCAKQSIKLWFGQFGECFPNKKNYKSFNKLLHVISMQRCEIFQPNRVSIFNKLQTSTDMFKIHTLNLLIFPNWGLRSLPLMCVYVWLEILLCVYVLELKWPSMSIFK